MEPYFDYTFFDVWKFRDVIQFAVAIALGFAGTYTLTNVWVIADYTDPKITDKWKLRYMQKFWHHGLPYTLGVLVKFWLFLIILAFPLAFWFGFNQEQELLGVTSGNGGRSFSTKMLDTSYMGGGQGEMPTPSQNASGHEHACPHTYVHSYSLTPTCLCAPKVNGRKGGLGRDGNYAQAEALVFCGMVLSTTLWLVFVLVILATRVVFKAKTRCVGIYGESLGGLMAVAGVLCVCVLVL